MIGLVQKNSTEMRGCLAKQPVNYHFRLINRIQKNATFYISLNQAVEKAIANGFTYLVLDHSRLDSLAQSKATWTKMPLI
ncbi:MAG: hypothetical protein LBH49_01180 [Puniceicoccales bacterium]|nr:hypothetical protein [Puniceicoccales bacterium]